MKILFKLLTTKYFAIRSFPHAPNLFILGSSLSAVYLNCVEPGQFSLINSLRACLIDQEPVSILP